MNMMKQCVYLLVGLLALVLLSCGLASAENNIEFLDKALISELNSGIYEIVTPKLESDSITYARQLPFDKLDFVERNEKYYSIGTAFFINDKELITAAHVFHLMFFSKYHDFYIRDAKGVVYPVGQIHQHSILRDIIVFTLKKYPQHVVPLAMDGKIEVGDTVFSVGNAQGEGIAYRAGQVASFTPEREYGKWKNIRFTSPASPGNSGGPLLDLQGRVVGVIVQKNQNENYNVAIPIAEAHHLGNEASFHIRNVRAGIYGVDETVNRDWQFTTPLPDSVEHLARLSQDSLNDHFLLLNKELQEQVKDRNYPRGKRFREYLRNQPYVKGIAPLLPGKGFRTWRAIGGMGEKIPVTAEQNVYRTKGLYANLHVIVEKPSDVDLQTFIDSPRLVMDNLLKAIPFYRQVGQERVNIVSFGEPAKKRVIADKLGRKWTNALWDLPYNDYFVQTSCLPYPGGVICLVDSKKNAVRKYGYFDSLYDGYNEISVGYKGSIKKWQEFFRLGKKYLGTVFYGASIQFDKTGLDVHLKDFDLHVKGHDITEESSVHLHMGYDPARLLAEDVLLFELIPLKGARQQFRVQPFFEPGVFSSDDYKSTWDDVIHKTGDYSGAVIRKGDKVVIRQAVESTLATIPTVMDQPLQKVFAWGCFFAPSAANINEQCHDFVKGLVFHPQTH